MNLAQPSQQDLSVFDTLYVEQGTQKCRIFAIRGKLRPGQSPEAMLNTLNCKEVGLLESGRIVALEKQYWPTADETQLTGGMVLDVKRITMVGRHAA